MGKRGVVEEQTVRVSAMVKASEQLTLAGVFSTTIISHPTEGFLVSGEEEMTRHVMELIDRAGLRGMVNVAQMRTGGMLNHLSTRKMKEKMLMKLYKCVLPPLPMPLSDMKSLVLLQQQFGKVWDCELKGQRFKVGDSIDIYSKNTKAF